MLLKSKKHSFDLVAPFYDSLAKLAFGNVLKQAQATYLSEIPPNSKILIIGGGTGWIATKVMEIAHPFRILYLELSEKMLRQSKERWNVSYPEKKDIITFICDSEQYLEKEPELFDVIITPFVLDVYPYKALEKMCQLLDTSLSKGGLWLFSDFHIPPYPYKLLALPLIQIMYMFFKWTCKIPASKLPPFETIFDALPLEKKGEKLYFFNCVQSIIWKKI